MSTAFPWSSDEFDALVRKAVSAYWTDRARQSTRQILKGTKDSGSRGEVTGGQHLNAFANLLVAVMHEAGCPSQTIHFSKPLVLPGFYRAQKKWDLVVEEDGQLRAAIELKSQSGSFGNNLNNRAEEVLGLAKDFWTAYRERAFGVSPQPWLGYLFLLEDAPASRSPVGLSASKFPPFAAFENSSYQDRYRILCERLVLERDYTATALLTSAKGATDGQYAEPSKELSVYQFAASLFHHLRRG